MSIDLVLLVPNSDVEALVQDLKQDTSIFPEVIHSAGASGEGDLVTVLINLTPDVLDFLAIVIVAWINRPRVKVEIGGLKITGDSSTIKEILTKFVASNSSLQKPEA